LQKYIFVLAGMICLCVANAQPDAQFNFSHYSTATGLPSNQVNSVVQDEKGYIWIGSTDGLIRFDGVRYKLFRHKVYDASSIAANTIWKLLLDKKKNLWLLTADGHAGIFNTSNFTYRDARIRCKNESALKTGVKRLTTDIAGNIFLIINAYEVLTWDEGRNEFAIENNFFVTPADWGITAFAQQPGTQKYWIGRQGGGIAVYNRSTGKLSYEGNNAENEPAVEKFKGLQVSCNFLFDSKERVWFSIWVGGLPYVYCYDTKSQQVVINRYEFFSVLKDYNEVQGFFEEVDGTIWVIGVRVFARYQEREKNFVMVPAGYTNERSIDYRIVTSLYEDRDHNIWAGTANNGLFRFNPSETYFTNISHRNKNTGKKGDGNPLCFTLDKDGTLLTGIWGEGLYRYDRNFNNIPLNIKKSDDSNFVALWSMYHSRDSNTIWMGGQPGIYEYNQHNHSAKYYNPAVFQNRTVKQVLEDRNGKLWLGMQAIGVFKWDPVKSKPSFEDGLSKFTAIPDAQINFMKIDKQGWIWICTRQAGVYVINPENDSIVMHFHSKAIAEQQLPEDNSTAMLEYNDSLVVIATAAHLMLYNRTGKKISFIRSSDILSGFITAVEKDSAGNLWISSSSALYRYNFNNKMFISYNRDDGITSDYFLPASSFVLPDGQMLFGAAGQFIAFDPQRIAKENKMEAGNITLTDFKVMNQPLLVDSLMQLQQITLDHDQSSLVIEFSQLSFTSPLLTQYKLDDLDKDWQTADRSNQAIYSYLPPGEYHLHFRTINPEGNKKNSHLQLNIKITPPFWKSWWFYSLLGLIAALLIYWFDKEWLKRKAVMQKMRSDIAGNLHEEINSALGNINILSEMALMKSEKEPEKSKEFIRQIHSRSHNMIIAMDDMLWSISPDNDSMDKTVERMREYIDALKNRHQVNIELLVDKDIGKLELNMRLRHEAFVLFKEGIQSLVTAGVTYCAIEIGSDKNELLYTMQFSNAGADMQQLNNLLQRQDMEKHMSAINAVFNVKVHKTNSVFVLKLPLE
jgi:ligand-binding sensor domain-containing protein